MIKNNDDLQKKKVINTALLDRSIVFPDPISPEKSLINSLLNNIVISLSTLTMTINLILLGQFLYEKINHYELFMIYQIGVFILDFLGRDYIIGLIKNLFDNNQDNDFYYLYIKMKTSLVFLIPIILVPVSIFSIYIIQLILNINFDICDQFLIKEVYYKFILFSPVIYLFEILFLLNIHFLHQKEKRKEVFLYTLFFIIAHISLSYILLNILQIGLIGLTISYFFNSFLFYLSSNKYIQSLREDENQSFFFLIPNKDNFDVEVFNLFKEKSILSLVNLGEVFIFQFLFVSSLFTDKNQLIVNIIYLSFYELFSSVFRGFYYNLKNYILKNKEDARQRQKYVLTFAFYVMILVLFIFLLLIIFKNILLNCYLLKGGDEILKIISYKLRIFFPLCVLISGIRIILNAIIRGMNLAFPIIKKILYIVIYIILCLILCFYYNYGIYGLWISLFFLNVFFMLESIHKAILYFPLFFNNI